MKIASVSEEKALHRRALSSATAATVTISLECEGEMDVLTASLHKTRASLPSVLYHMRTQMGIYF